jgi:hypothetical protein
VLLAVTADGTTTYSDAGHSASLAVTNQFFGEVASIDEVSACGPTLPRDPS